MVEAANKTKIQLPIVLRLEGTNVEQGQGNSEAVGIEFYCGGDHERRGGESGCSGGGAKGGEACRDEEDAAPTQ